MTNALKELKKLKTRLKEAEYKQREPIAVIGMSCRVPGGVSDLDGFWQLLCEGRDTVAEVPAERWNIDEVYDEDADRDGKMLTRNGSFLENIDQFDADFFGIAPREAVRLDPQQRLLLETSWEALEHASVNPHSLDGSATGVFVGMCWNDYQKILASRPLEEMDTYVMLGTARSGAAGRISHFLGLQGPCFALDTACSSSLVSVHQACESLRRGESDMALAGGVSLMLTPQTTINASRAKMISPDGRCKTFDASADGFGRAEGCGMVVLKRLSDARKDRDRILALVRGSAINQDGRTSGLTVPSGLSQEKVLRKALQVAGVTPEQVSYLEAHGTGTSLGDPIEIGAATKVYCKDRQQPLMIGSLKTNIGHAEGAAGILGMIKVVLMLHHRAIPKHLHVHNPSPHIDWYANFEVVQDHRTWDVGEESRLAGLSSFGFTGTNAHAIFEEAPAQEDESLAAQSCYPLVLSARSQEALQQSARRLQGFLKEYPNTEVASLCATATCGRAPMPVRLFLCAQSTEQVGQDLEKFAAGERTRNVTTGEVWGGVRARPVFMFTGQGSQYVQMGKELYDHEPVFKDALDRCAQLLDEQMSKPLFEVLFGDQAETIDNTMFTQPSLFALEVALATLVKSWGLTPSAAIGHSVGEYAAAWLAGVFSLEDGCKLIAARARLMAALPEGGKMVAIFAPREEVIQAMSTQSGQLSIAATNGPVHTVVSGEGKAVDAVVAPFADGGIKCKELIVSHAFHSPLMEPMLAEFRQVAQGISFQAPKLDLIANSTGALAGNDITTPEYWVNHVMAEVRFFDGVTTLHGKGYRHFLELGPRPILTALGRGGVEDPECAWVPTLRKGRDPLKQMLEAVGNLHLHGLPIEWPAVFGSTRIRPISLPSYPFQRQTYWTEPMSPQQAGAATHAYPGQRLPIPYLSQRVYATSMSQENPTFVADHRLFGLAVVPAGSHVAMALAAAADTVTGTCTLSDLHFPAPLVLSEQGQRQVHTILDPDSAGHGVRVASLTEGKDPHQAEHWITHAQGHLAAVEETAENVDLSHLQQTITTDLDVDTFNASWGSGYHRGSSFLWLTQLATADKQVLAKLNRPSSDHVTDQTPLFPGLLDSCFQLLAACTPTSSMSADDSLQVPASLERFTFYPTPPEDTLWCHAQLTQTDESGLKGDLTLCTESGKMIAQIQGLQTRRIQRSALMQALGSTPLYEIVWREAEAVTEPTKHGNWLIFGSDTTGLDLAKELRQRGHKCTLVNPGESWGQDGDSATVNPADPEHFKKLCNKDVEGVLYLWPLIEGENNQRMHRSLQGALHLVQALTQSGAHEPGLWLVTRNTQMAAGDTDPYTATLWGFGRTLMLEHPQVKTRLLDLDTSSEDDSKHILTAIDQTQNEPQVSIADGKRHVARIASLKCSPKPLAVQGDATYLITGGLGGLGLVLAEHMVSNGARHLVLTSRRAPNEAAQARIAAMTASGATIRAEQTDITDRSQIQAMLTRLEGMPPVRGVVHGAGVLDDGMLTQQTWERYQKVLAPKVLGSSLLAELLPADTLDFMVCHSSIASMLGSVGQSNYAAANAFMDGLMRSRNPESRSLSIHWGPWAQAGMAASLDETQKRRMRQIGLETLTPVQGNAALDRLLGHNHANAGVVSIDWQTYAGALPANQNNPFLEEVDSQQQGTPTAQIPLTEELEELVLVEREDHLMHTVRHLAAGVLGLHSADAVKVAQSFFDLGMDSLTAVEFKNGLEGRLGRSVRTSLVFDFPTPREMTDHLKEKVLADLFTVAEEKLVEETADTDPPEALSEEEAEALLLKELEDLDF